MTEEEKQEDQKPEKTKAELCAETPDRFEDLESDDMKLVVKVMDGNCNVRMKFKSVNEAKIILFDINHFIEGWILKTVMDQQKNPLIHKPNAPMPGRGGMLAKMGFKR